MKIGLVFGFVLILDQLTKWLVRQNMTVGDSVSIIGNFIRITYVENPGIAFGIHVSNRLIFTILSVLASVGVAGYLFTHWKEKTIKKISLVLILGGAIGNIIDRIFFYNVVDFIDIGIGDLRWWVFNVADSSVVIGVILLLIITLSNQGEKSELEPDEAESAG